ncbi:BLUF domain-containing protein [Spirosoma sp.]|uniref:BLUF domain-containing protein n=1 Tax=Spirosoma sp. TaxID=1899569 RepID=UPI003B39FD54
MEQCIVYFSSAPNLSLEDLHTILTQSRSNNSQQGITGVILYVKGNIIQVLEGEPTAVEQLYQRIQHDPRHGQISTVLNRPIIQRTFEKWSMGFETITTQQLEEIKDLIDLEGTHGRGSQANDPILLRTLKVFYQSNRYN